MSVNAVHGSSGHRSTERCIPTGALHSLSEAVGAQCSSSCPTGPHIPPALQHIAGSFLPSLAALSILVESFVHHCFCNAPLVAQGAFAKE